MGKCAKQNISLTSQNEMKLKQYQKVKLKNCFDRNCLFLFNVCTKDAAILVA
jgi:hypothetical protein